MEEIKYYRHRNLKQDIGFLFEVFTCHRHLFPSSLCFMLELSVEVQVHDCHNL